MNEVSTVDLQEYDPFAGISWITFPTPEGCSFTEHAICATEEDYALLLERSCGLVPGERGWNRDPKVLRFDGASPASGGMYAPFAHSAEYAPYPLVHLCGTTRTDWRNPIASALKQEGLLSLWADQVPGDIFERLHTNHVVAMMALVWGADVMVYEPGGAGRYSVFERDVAQYLGIPVYEMGSDPVGLASQIWAEQMPIRHVPFGNPGIFAVVQEHFAGITGNEIQGAWWDMHGNSERHTVWGRNAWGILQRRAYTTPWGSMNIPVSGD